MRDKLSREGLALSILLPANWILVYYSFMLHVWLTLGRWPNFGEKVPGPLASWHAGVVLYHYVALVYSLYLAGALILITFWQPSWRHLSLYALCYAAGVGIATLVLFFLSPAPFLNWLLD